MISYPAKKTELRGDEIPVTDEMRAQAFWLIRKYSSLTYISRMLDVFSSFMRGYEQYAVKQTKNVAILREDLMEMSIYQGLLQKGVDMILHGYKAGYAKIRRGSRFGGWLIGPRFDGGYTWEQFGYQEKGHSTGLGAFVEVSVAMAIKVEATLNASWAFPRVLDSSFDPYGVPQKKPPFEFPAGLELLPPPGTGSVRSGREVPMAGIWVSDDKRIPCPNFLIEGQLAPPAQRLARRADWPAIPPSRFNPTGTPPMSIYTYEPEPTVWRLHWRDDRYRGGQIPEEEEACLDPSTDIPELPHPADSR